MPEVTLQQLDKKVKEKEQELEDFRKHYHYVINKHRQLVDDLFEITRQRDNVLLKKNR